MKKQFTLKYNGENLLSPWEINEILKKISGLYFKNEMLLDIKRSLNKQVNPSNIWILNESVKLKNKYDKLKEGVLNLCEPKEVLELYHMGSPIPLYPNKRTFRIFLAFEFFRSVYNDCYRKNLSYPDKSKVVPVIYKLAKVDNSINEFQDELSRLISVEIQKTNSSKSPEKNEETKKTVNRIMQKRKQMFDITGNINDIDEQLDIVIRSLIEDGIQLNSEEAKDRLKPFKSELFKFNNYFNKNQRPFVLQYDPESDKLFVYNHKLISKSYFNKDNEQFFETNRIEQNSPFILTACVAVSFAPSLANLIKSKLKQLEDRKEHIQKEKKVTKEIDTLEKKHDTLEKEIETLEKKLDALQSDVSEENVDLEHQDDELSEFQKDIVQELEKKQEKDEMNYLIDHSLNIEDVRDVK